MKSYTATFPLLPADNALLFLQNNANRLNALTSLDHLDVCENQSVILGWFHYASHEVFKLREEVRVCTDGIKKCTQFWYFIKFIAIGTSLFCVGFLTGFLGVFFLSLFVFLLETPEITYILFRCRTQYENTFIFSVVLPVFCTCVFLYKTKISRSSPSISLAYSHT